MTSDGSPAPAGLEPRELRVPVPDDAPRHMPTSTVVLPGSVALTSWVEGRASTRLGVLDLRTGQWRVLSGLRGMLRDALALPGDRALLLTDYMLIDLDLAAGTIVRQLTAKIGKHNTYLRRDDDDVVAVGTLAAPTESLVSVSALEVLKRRRRTLPPVSTAADAPPAGVARVLASGAGLLIGATDTRASAPQRLCLRSADDHAEIGVVDFPDGLQSAHLCADGVIAAAPDIGQVRTLTVIPGVQPRAADSTALPLEDLVVTANDSASALFQTRAKRNPPRTVYRDVRLESGAELADLTGRRITLENCVAGRSELHHARPRIARIRVTDLELQASSPNGAVLEDVTIDGLRCPESSGFWFGCEFRRVTFRGRIRGLILNPDLHDADDAVTAQYAQWHRDRMDDPEWMLDLTEATGSITIRGYPSRFIRRNPALQAVVTADAARTLDWRSIDAGRSSLWVALDELVRSDWEDVTLIADTHDAHAEDDLRYLTRLRDAGIARPD